MLKHIVMWQLKPEAHGNDKAINAQLIKTRLEVGIDVLHTDSSADVVLYSEFDSLAALEHYQKHPEHLELMPFILEARKTRMVVDYT